MTKKYPQYIIDKAIQLRVEKKYTVPEIADMMGIAKSTVDGWLKPYKLEERTQKQTEAQKRGTEAMKKKYADMRDEAYQEAWEQAPELFQNPEFREFITLYLAEGSKRNRNKVEMTNSDVAVMIKSLYWMKKLGNPDNIFSYRVQIHIDHDESEIKDYWAKALQISPNEIQIMRKSNSGKLSGRQFRSKHGVFAIQLADTYFHARIKAWIHYLRQGWFAKYTNGISFH